VCNILELKILISIVRKHKFYHNKNSCFQDAV